jgi:cysteine desulfurase
MRARRMVYLDSHATTQPDPRVVDAMLPYLREQYGNAASAQHEYGWIARAAVDVAREKVAALIGAEPGEVLFTSGATESINLALKGVAEAYSRRTGKRGHIIATAVEHRAVLDTCEHLKRQGVRVTILPVDGAGRVRPVDLQKSLGVDTFLVSVILANNEIGTIMPLDDVATICRQRDVLLHADAAQACGKIPVDVGSLQADLISISAHKMYGPKGIGALWVRKRLVPDRIIAQIDGGGHEKGLRSGTLNVPSIVGFGAAAEIACIQMREDALRTVALRGQLLDGMRQGLDDIRENGDIENRLPNNANITFYGAPADRVLMQMKDVAVSSGSACSSAMPEPSHVLRAIGLSEVEAKSTLRFGLGRFTTEDDIALAVARTIKAVQSVRATLRTVQNPNFQSTIV